MYNVKDSIVALATIPGKSALNVLRVSGSQSKYYFKKLTRSSVSPKTRYANIKTLFSSRSNRKIDKAIITFFKGPKSYTGEDMLEVSVHGGVIISQRIINTLLFLGAREAMPGEFSYRAYLNNKIDLIQAESISSIVGASNSLESFYHLNNIVGSLSKDLIRVKTKIVSIIASCERLLDFDEEEIIPKQTFGSLRTKLEKIQKNIIALKDKSFCFSEQNGCPRVVIMGKPNVGKSSLFNIIANKEHAIVTKISGTTTDAIEKNISLKNITINLIDTAGIRKTNNIIEKKGIKKTYQEIKKANIIIVLDDRKPRNFFSQKKQQTILLVQNKSDLSKKKDHKADFYISCKTGRGIRKFLTSLSTLVCKNIDDVYGKYSYSINNRQKNLIEKIGTEIDFIEKNIENNDLVVLVSQLYCLVDLFNEICSPTNQTDIINKIFSEFCIGK